MNLKTIITIIFSVSHCGSQYINEAGWPDECKSGQAQSPVDFSGAESGLIRADKKIKLEKVEYKEIKDGEMDSFYGFKLWLYTGNNLGEISVIKDEVRYNYYLEYIQILSPAEHYFDGSSLDFEVQMVHTKNTQLLKLSGVIDDKDNRNNFWIISTIYRVDDLTEQKFPLALGPVKNFTLNNFNDLSTPLYFYEGSFTHPPCKETVNWVVFDKINLISEESAEAMRKLINEKVPLGTTRGKKSIGDRKVYYVTQSVEALILESWAFIITILIIF